MNRRDMKKEMYWAIWGESFGEGVYSLRSAIEHLQPKGRFTPAAKRRFNSLAGEISEELQSKGGS